jgi:glycosyltransferase involved in cell wall biosynthesis
VVALGSVRILLDYRPALRDRTGVGEYVHELTRALSQSGHDDEISVFSTSWKDRPVPGLAAALGGVRVIDRRLPVRGVMWTWHRFEWPPVEWLAGAVDVVHAQSPLLIPARRAAQVITIHDLDFLHHPERASAEMRRDFPRLVGDHARRADHVIVSSHYAAREVAAHLEIQGDKIAVCSPGAPEWAARIATSRTAARAEAPILFIGTIEERKNVRRLLEAYAVLRQRRADAPPLVLAGRVKDSVGEAPHVTFLGYVSEAQRQELYRQARMLVLPSLEEGFGLPVLEAMACGVPVVISNRGALPEVAGDAATPLDPTDVAAIAEAMERLLDPVAAQDAINRGLAQSARYSWAAAAAAAREAYRAAVAARARRTP